MTVPSSPDASLAQVAVAQFGCFTSRQARAAGFTDAAIASRLRRGVWRSMSPGVLIAATSPASRAATAVAARLQAGEGAAFSSYTSGRLLGIDVMRDDPRVWLRVPWVSGARSRAGVRVTRSRISTPIATAHGQPVVPAARTLLDLAAHLDEREILGALYDSVRRGITTIEAVTAECELVASGLAGLGRMRRAVEKFSPQFESMVETAAAGGFLDGGIPLAPQVEIWDGPFLVARLDFADEWLRFGVEIDGYRYHGTRDAQRRDRARDRRLHALGWTISRFDATDVLDRLPKVVAEVRRIRSALLERRRLAG